MSHNPSKRFLLAFGKLVGPFLVVALLALSSWRNVQAANPLAQQQKQKQTQKQKQEQPEEKPETTTTEVPKPPKDDVTVQVYRVLDENKANKLTFKEKYKHDKTEEDVEIVVNYFNWAVSDDDYWNRQLSIDIKNKDGFVIEKIVKSGFGELGYVKEGDQKTQDIFRKEKITESGGVATATMVDAEIGPVEKGRYQHIIQKYVLKK